MRVGTKRLMMWLAAIMAVVVVAFMGCGQPQTAGPKYGGVQFLTFMGGTVGGSAYNIIAKQASQVQKSLTGITTNTIEGASEKNLAAIEQGKAQLGYAETTHVQNATKGQWEVGTPTKKLRFFKHYVLHGLAFVVRNDSPVKTIKDLLGRHIALKPKGFGSNDPALAILSEYGITEETNRRAGGAISYLSTNDQARGLKDKTVDVIVGAQTPFEKMAHLIEPEETFGLRMLEVDQAVLDKVIKANMSLSPGVIKGGIYRGNPNSLAAVGLMYNIYVSADVPDDLAYDMAKVLFEPGLLKELVTLFADQITVWTPENCMLGALPPLVPVHPGVLRYANEKGLKPTQDLKQPTAEALSWMPGAKK